MQFAASRIFLSDLEHMGVECDAGDDFYADAVLWSPVDRTEAGMERCEVCIRTGPVLVLPPAVRNCSAVRMVQPSVDPDSDCRAAVRRWIQERETAVKRVYEHVSRGFGLSFLYSRTEYRFVLVVLFSHIYFG